MQKDYGKNSNMDFIFLIINILLYVYGYYVLLRKYGFRNIGTWYMIFYGVLAIGAFDLYLSDLEFGFRWIGISLFCFFYLFLFIFLFSNQLARFIVDKLYIAHPSSNLIVPLSIIVILLSLLNIIDVITDFRQGLVLLLMDEGYGNHIYAELNDLVHTGRGNRERNYVTVFSNLAKNIAPFLFLYYLTRRHKNILITLGLALSSVVSIMAGVSQGSRLAIVQGLMNLLAAFFLFKNFYSPRLLKWSKPVGVGLLLVFVLGFSLITISRSKATKQGETFAFVEAYASKFYLTFGNYGIDNGEIRYGERTLPLFKSVFSDNVARSYADRETKFNHMKVGEGLFVSFVGDCVFDYGLVGGALFLLFFLWMFHGFISSRNISIVYFDQLIISYLIICLLNGFYAWPFSDVLGNLVLFSFLFLALFFRNYRHESKVY